MREVICKFCNQTYIKKNKYSVSVHNRTCEGLKRLKDIVLTKEYFEKEYILKERSAIDIANEHGLTSSTLINNLLKKYDIPKRNISESAKTYTVREKYKNTCLGRYGTENCLSRGSEVRDKMEEYMLETYGVINPFEIEELKELIHQNSMESKYANGTCVKPEDLTEWKIYRYNAINIANKNYKDYYNFINIDEVPRGRNLYHLDHIMSIKWGFENNINPELISHPSNLRMITEFENISKSDRCDLTEQEFYDNIEMFNKIIKR